ncbi:NTP/NDP exchange transporter [Halomonas sp. M20]|uniref:NTP/NDP exchange transporter n=1 Tax=Halomonas sp. M20 TaxID=2763264 RepID=UPI001D09F915|nr:MFS transporter [Halomonas sp. M20]
MSFLTRLLNLRPREAPPVLAGLALFFLLFTGYFMLRPVRETMGVAGGVDNLQWLFTGTFVSTLLVLPLFGWLASRVARRRILPYAYGFFIANLLLFAALFLGQPENPWLARTFYIWLSVFNLVAISLAWSVLADVFSTAQAKRLFGMMAGGASLGGLVGPSAGILLVAPLQHSGLLALAALLLAGSIGAAIWLYRWRDRNPLAQHERPAEEERHVSLGGNPFDGAVEVARTPFLMGIALFVVLLASVSTFLYFEQAELVAERFPDPVQQTQVFGLIDMVVQALAIFTQVFLTGRIAQRLGIGVLLVAVPLVIAVGFVWLALAPTFAIFVVIMVARRFGEYALVRPGREMLYTVVSPQQKFKAKNFIDTVVYRGGDAISGWLKRALDLLAELPGLAMFIGAGIALTWAGTGFALGRAQQRREAENVMAEAKAEKGALT